MPELRPYQNERLARLRAKYQEGKRRLLVSLPTGTGKTVVFATFPPYFRMKRKMLVLAHREELLEQARDKIRRVNPDLKVGIERGERHAPANADVVIASVPTLGRQGSGRLAALDPEAFYLIVVDEAHHAVAASYRRVFDHFQLFAPDNKRMLVGFTATPRRGDRRGLGEVFEEIAYARGLEEMIREGYLCRINGWRIRTEVGLDNVRVTNGDFAEKELATAVNTPDRNELVLKAYHLKAKGRRCIIFCADVAHAQTVAKRFNGAKYRTECIWGEMPTEDRRKALKRFREGKLDVLTNVNVLTEGYDEPSVDAIIMARPTKSLSLYAQMVGRGTRLHPGKTGLVVIDIVDNTTKHKLAGLHALLDLPEHLNLKGSDALHAVDAVRSLERDHPYIDLDRVTDARELPLVLEKVNLFRDSPSDEIRAVSDFMWLATANGGFRIGLSGGQFTVESDLLDRWEIRLRVDGKERLVGHEADWEQAIRAADRVIREDFPDALKLVKSDAAWRNREPTEGQVKILQSMELPHPEGLTRGQASVIIDYAFAARRNSRRA